MEDTRKDYVAIGQLPHWEAVTLILAGFERRGPPHPARMRRLHDECENCASRKKCAACGGASTVTTRHGDAVQCESCRGTGYLKDFTRAETIGERRPFALEAWARCEGCAYSYYGEVEMDNSLVAAFASREHRDGERDKHGRPIIVAPVAQHIRWRATRLLDQAKVKEARK